MWMQQKLGLTKTQKVTLLLYGWLRDKELPEELRTVPSVSIVIAPGRPFATELFDIAYDFSRSVQRKPRLGRCFDVALQTRGKL